MPVNQPPIKEDPVESSWDFEVTQNINALEQRIITLLQEIRNAQSLEDLQTRVERL